MEELLVGLNWPETSHSSLSNRFWKPRLVADIRIDLVLRVFFKEAMEQDKRF